MLNPDLCTEDEITHLVHSFYQRVRGDAMLGPVFTAHIADEQWPVHLSRMVDFWSSLLRGTARYSGSPMSRHVVLPELSPALFQRWIELFDATTASLDNRELAARAHLMARRIARSLWLGFQTTNYPDRLAADLTLPA